MESNGALFVKTRKRKEDREYKTDGKVTKFIIENIEKVLESDSDTAEKLFCDSYTSHGPSWLIGRHVKTVKQKNVIKDNYEQQLTSEIWKQLVDEMEEKLNKKVQQNMRKLLKKIRRSES
ncbi:hypothetical protein POM88_023528 [Heracleum sosnowskyi]|uniref:Uncharacterized protein n=1 Tax=Heracleum sosnowskyi TaxID=360622 RepID=A0AAD8IIH1_9APIA|nr:hypothetical protein POM88_023528 [Heracleum sosnowskyi]